MVTILVSIWLFSKADDSPFIDRVERLYFTAGLAIFATFGVGFAMWSFRLDGIKSAPAWLSIFVNGGFVIYAISRLARVLL